MYAWNRLAFEVKQFCWGRHNITKNIYCFWQFKDYKSRGKQRIPFFHRIFWLYFLPNWFLYLKIVKIDFYVVLPEVDSGHQNTCFFGQRLQVFTVYHSFQEKDTEDAKNPYYVCPYRGAENHSFQWLRLMSLVSSLIVFLVTKF